MRDQQWDRAVQTSRAAGQEKVVQAPHGTLSPRWSIDGGWLLDLKGPRRAFYTTKLPALNNARSAFFCLHSGQKEAPPGLMRDRSCAASVVFSSLRGPLCAGEA